MDVYTCRLWLSARWITRCWPGEGRTLLCGNSSSDIDVSVVCLFHFQLSFCIVDSQTHSRNLNMPSSKITAEFIENLFALKIPFCNRLCSIRANCDTFHSTRIRVLSSSRPTILGARRADTRTRQAPPSLELARWRSTGERGGGGERDVIGWRWLRGGDRVLLDGIPIDVTMYEYMYISNPPLSRLSLLLEYMRDSFMMMIYWIMVRANCISNDIQLSKMCRT